MNPFRPDKKIRILFTLHNLDPGGVERHLLSVLRKLDYSVFEPYVCCLEKYGDFIEPIEKMGIEVIDLSTKSLYSIDALIGMFKLASYIRKKEIDIVHNFLFKSIVVGTFAARIAGLPVIINGRRDMGWALNRRQRLLLDLTNRWSDKIIAVCNAVKGKAVNTEKIGKGKIEVIYNGVDLDQFSPNRVSGRNYVRSEFGISQNDMVVGTITHLTEVKGNDYLIRASPLILSAFPNTKFLVVGDGPLKKELEALSIGMEVRDHFIFVGQRNDIPNILSSMNVYVCPSLSEGCSNSILEAMAMEKPIVATDVGGNKELIRQGHNGILVEPKDHEALAENIIKILPNQEMAQRMGACGRQLVKQNYAMKHIANQLMQLYISVFNYKMKTGKEDDRDYSY